MSNVIHKRVNTKGVEDGLGDSSKPASSPVTSPALSSSSTLRRLKARSAVSKARVPFALCLAALLAIAALLHYETSKVLHHDGFKTELDPPHRDQKDTGVFVTDKSFHRGWLRPQLFFNRSREAYKYSVTRPTTKRYLDRLEAFGRGNYGNCTANQTEWGREQVCCGVEHNAYPNKVYRWCLPGLVVMGSQKGGTTALHSYLMLHPNLEPSGKKELHAYDVQKNFMRLPR